MLAFCSGFMLFDVFLMFFFFFSGAPFERRGSQKAFGCVFFVYGQEPAFFSLLCFFRVFFSF